MTVAMKLAMAVACMVMGHIFKVKRWRLFISVYEELSESGLLNAMALGHAINIVLPLRLGDIVRVVWCGRKLKNSYPLSLATVIADLYFDVITVGAMFFVLSLIGKGGEKLLRMAHFYMCVFLVLIPFTLLCVLFRKPFKKVIRMIAGLFNEKIEFILLYVSYLCIAALKDIVKKMKKIKFLGYTAGIWSSYAVSYIIFAESVQGYGYYYSASDVFAELFSGVGFYHIIPELMPLWGVYLLIPLSICRIISMADRRRTDDLERGFHVALPQMNQTDRLAFLKTYYDDENREQIQAYLEINKDVAVVEDNSAGSNASTLLVMKQDGALFYRKYAFGEDGNKLWAQIDWIEKHQADIPLPVIANKRRECNYAAYDMHSYGGTVGLFRYIHTVPVECCWPAIEKVLNDIGSGLHAKNVKAADIDTVRNYIDNKVHENIRLMLEQDRYIRNLESFSEIRVNGTELPTLKFYRDILDREHLEKIFRQDTYADIHGDFTVENIIFLSDSHEVNAQEYDGKVCPATYYLIDPNTGNVHDSPLLDYAKLLQSLHGNYEFLMMVDYIKIEKNHIDFLMTNSEAYARLYRKYRSWLKERFSKKEVLSIYYHEVVHWIRLMPYKIRKNKKLAVVFYAGLLTVLHDVWMIENEE